MTVRSRELKYSVAPADDRAAARNGRLRQRLMSGVLPSCSYMRDRKQDSSPSLRGLSRSVVDFAPLWRPGCGGTGKVAELGCLLGQQAAPVVTACEATTVAAAA